MNAADKILVACMAAAFLVASEHAVLPAEAPKKEGRVTWIVRDVKLLSSKAAARAAVINDNVREGTGVRTGDESRSELTFLDTTITRLGANTVFSFTGAGRNIELGSGSILFSVPKDSGGARMMTSAVTVGITGTTLTLEATRAGRNRLIVLEGGARLSLNKYPRESAYVRAGQMLDVPPGATKLPKPVDIDLGGFMKTSPLIADFPPLPTQGLISASGPTRGPGVYPRIPVVGVVPPSPGFGPTGTGKPPGQGQGGQHKPPGSSSGSQTSEGTAGTVPGHGNTGPGKGQGQGQVTKPIPSRGKTPVPPRRRKTSQGQHIY